MVESLTVESLLSEHQESRFNAHALARAAAAHADFQAHWSTPEEHALLSVTSRRGIIVYVNDRFCDVSGYSRQELIGAAHGRVGSGRHSHRFWRDLWRTIGAGRLWRGEICNRAHDGTEYWVQSIIRPLRRGDGIFGFVAVSRLMSDGCQMTEPRRLEKLRAEAGLQSLSATGWG